MLVSPSVFHSSRASLVWKQVSSNEMFDLGPFELIPSGWLYFWLCGWSGKLSSHTLNQSDAKLKPITTWSPAFSRALGYLLIFPWSSTWLYKVFPFLLIGHLRIPEEDFSVYTNGISLKKGLLALLFNLMRFFKFFFQPICSSDSKWNQSYWSCHLSSSVDHHQLLFGEGHTSAQLCGICECFNYYTFSVFAFPFSCYLSLILYFLDNRQQPRGILPLGSRL